MTGDDHNTDALIAALRSPALPAERAGEAAAVSAMLGVIARVPASTRFRAGRGIAIAVVTVASLGVGGLAAAGPGVFQAAASKARSLITADSADSESNADAVTGDDPLGGSSPDGLAGDPGSLAALGAAASLQAGETGGVPCADTPGNVPATAQDVCGQPTSGAGPAPAAAPPPACADGNHGDAVAPGGSVPPSTPPRSAPEVTVTARAACTPQGPQSSNNQGEVNPNKPAEQPAGPPISTPNPGPNQGSTHQGGATPPATTPPQANGNGRGNGQDNGSGESEGDGVVVDQSTPAADNAQDAPDRRGGTSEGAQNSGDNGQADVPPANVPPVNDNANVNARGNGG